MEVLRRAFRVLDVLASAGEPDLRLDRVSELVALAPSSTHRLLGALKEAGYVVQHAESGRYGLGYRPVALSSALLRRLDVRLVSLPHMIRLRDEMSETVTLSVRTGLQRVYVHQVESTHTVRATVEIGHPLPLYLGAAGKVLTAFAQPSILEDVVRAAMDAKPIRPMLWRQTTFRRDIDRVRRTDVAFGVGERILDLATVAVPIRNHDGVVVAALGLSGPRSRFSVERMNGLASEVRATALAISQELGQHDEGRAVAGRAAANRIGKTAAQLSQRG